MRRVFAIIAASYLHHCWSFFFYYMVRFLFFFFFFQAEDGIRDWSVTGVQTCALPISRRDELPDRPRLDSPPRRLDVDLHARTERHSSGLRRLPWLGHGKRNRLCSNLDRKSVV